MLVQRQKNKRMYARRTVLYEERRRCFHCRWQLYGRSLSLMLSAGFKRPLAYSGSNLTIAGCSSQTVATSSLPRG